MSQNTLTRIFAAALLLVAVFLFFQKTLDQNGKLNKTPFSLAAVLKERPAPLRHIYDFAGKIPHGTENHESQLDHFEKKYGVETIVVTVPSLEGRDIKETAVEIFSNWKIGKELGEKGLLLLVTFKEQEIKLEVGYGAEGVFTDLFCGYIERMAIQPFFQAGQFGDGLLAVWEHFIARAEETLTEEQMKKYLGTTAAYVSGGAGVKDIFQTHVPQNVKTLSPDEQKKFIPQPTPEALVEATRETCRLCVGLAAISMMTEASQVMTREIGMEPSRLQCDNGLKTWSGAYEILQEGNRAVAVFYTTDSAQPIMMEKGEKGWLLDVFHMRRHAWFDHSNKLYIKGKNFPYAFAFKEGKYASIPKDLYGYSYGLLAPATEGYQARLDELKHNAQKNPQDVQTLLELAKIYIDLTLRDRAADLLRQIILIAPQQADAHRYMSYVQLDLFGSPRKALEQIDPYLKLKPRDKDALLWKARCEERLEQYKQASETLKTYCGDYEQSVWCLNYLGYYSFLANQKEAAKKYFQKALKLNPDNSYAQDYLQKIESPKS